MHEHECIKKLKLPLDFRKIGIKKYKSKGAQTYLSVYSHTFLQKYNMDVNVTFLHN